MSNGRQFNPTTEEIKIPTPKELRFIRDSLLKDLGEPYIKKISQALKSSTDNKLDLSLFPDKGTSEFSYVERRLNDAGWTIKPIFDGPETREIIGYILDEKQSDPRY